MQFLKRVCYNGESDVYNNLVSIITSDEWQLDFYDIENYKKYKDITTQLIEEYKNPPMSFRCLTKGDAFEDSVVCLSEIEDITGYEIDHLVVPFNNVSDRINLCEFYGESKEISLEVSQSKEIIDAIAFIEYNKYNHVNLAISGCTYGSKWLSYDLFHAIKKYIGTICNCYYTDVEDIRDRLSCYSYEGLFIK